MVSAYLYINREKGGGFSLFLWEGMGVVFDNRSVLMIFPCLFSCVGGVGGKKKRKEKREKMRGRRNREMGI